MDVHSFANLSRRNIWKYRKFVQKCHKPYPKFRSSTLEVFLQGEFISEEVSCMNSHGN